MIVKKIFAPSLLISCNLVQFRGFSGLHSFGSSRFLPSLSRVARLHKKDRHLFDDASFQNGCGEKSVFASIHVSLVQIMPPHGTFRFHFF